MLIVWILVFQITFPDIPSPTPWQTPTPQATVDHFIDDSEDLVATAQSEEYTFEADGDVVEFNSQEILTDVETSDSLQLFAYFKWLVSSGVQSVFGPFAPLLVPVGILISLSLISLFVYFWENLIVTIFKIVGFIINNILRLLGR